ncbi:hypothetical protein [Methylocystis sp.]|uniref:hypothetical protein n=1 Tax=Methylocystis sp. TaxID=1911079 RepID=UPI0025DFEF0A|nr:hypothetical protein [Methylocystis sp.]
MRTGLRYSAICFIVALAGCGDERAANESNFGAALSKALGQDVCLGYSLTRLLDQFITREDAVVRRFDVLVRAGLLKNDQIEEVPQITGGVVKMWTYSLTTKGETFYQEKDIAENMFEPAKTVKRGDFCYGKLALGSVLKWEGPRRNGDYAEATVTYTYKIADAADWSAAPEIRAAFPRVGEIADSSGKLETQDVVRLTNLGWEAGPLSIVEGMRAAGAVK